ncbi:MAG: MvdC/MvdD family ATP grasp protein [Pseudonocardiaceae bacterium]
MTAGTVLVLSGPEDATADSVVAELVGLGAPIVRMDIGDFPLWMAMTAWLTHGTWRGELLTADRSVDLTEVNSVYYRRPTRFTFEDDMSDADAVFAGAEAQFGVGGVLAALDGVLWVNNPARLSFAEYKPVQLRIASGCGLHVPRTLVTNDHGAAREFAAAVGGKIACTRLAELGHHPTLVTGDGAQGLPGTAPFDRIIATCAVPAIPTQWITQLREGGVIVTDLRGDISSNLTVFRKINPRIRRGSYPQHSRAFHVVAASRRQSPTRWRRVRRNP